MAAAVDGPFSFKYLCDLGHKKITQARMRQAFGDDLFDETFGWTHRRLVDAGDPLEPGDILKLSERKTGPARDIQVAIIDDMVAKWPIFTQDHVGVEKNYFFHEVAPLALIYEANKKYRRQVREGRLPDRNQADFEEDVPIQPEDSNDSQLSTEMESPLNHLEGSGSTTNLKPPPSAKTSEIFEVWDIEAKERYFPFFMVEAFHQKQPSTKDLNYSTVLSLYHCFSKAKGMKNDQVLFQYVDKKSYNWPVFDDISLRSAFHQFQIDESQDPFFLLVDHGGNRIGPLRSPYDPSKQLSPANSAQARPETTRALCRDSDHSDSDVVEFNRFSM